VPLLISEIGLIGGAFASLGAAIAANPIGFAVAAIAGAAYLIYRNWDALAPYFSALWEGVKAIFTAGFEFVKSYFLNFTPLGLIVKNWEPIVTYFSGLWDRVKGFVDPILNAGRSVLGAIGGFFTGPAPSPARAGANILQQPAALPASPGPQSRGPLAGALAGGGQTKLNGELLVRFQDALPGTRVDPGSSNQPGLSINPDVGYRSQLAF